MMIEHLEISLDEYIPQEGDVRVNARGGILKLNKVMPLIDGKILGIYWVYSHKTDGQYEDYLYAIIRLQTKEQAMKFKLFWLPEYGDDERI